MDSGNNYEIDQDENVLYEENNVIEKVEEKVKEVEEGEVEEVEVGEEEEEEIISLQEIKEQAINITDDIDKRVAKYLINELEKKIQYISELEEILKFQEQEILSLKNKLETANKMELLIKLKNNMDAKSETLSNKIIIEENKKEENSSQEINELIPVNKKIEVIKPIGTNIDIISNKKTPQIVIEKSNDIDTIKLRRRARQI